MGSNIWPPTSLISTEEFREPVEAYFTEIYKLTLIVFEMLARTLPYGSHIFDEFIANNPATPMRLLHYPTARETEKPQFGSSPHTDFGAITLLLQDHNPGLQVQNTSTGEWIPVPPNPDGYVVNVGDMLSKWTGDEYKSSVHRVLNENKTDRYSVVFFFDGNLDCPLSPLDGSKVDGDVLTVEGHMIERMTTSYEKK
jgi:isopenicillin N synthase-like dioxygenase